MPPANDSVEIVVIEEKSGEVSCGACHMPIVLNQVMVNSGVWIGRPSFVAPAIAVCSGCVIRAMEMLGIADRMELLE